MYAIRSYYDAVGEGASQPRLPRPDQAHRHFEGRSARRRPRRHHRRRQKAINPEKYAALEEPETEGFLCDECGFEAKSAAGLRSHARKHQEG